MSRFMQCVLKLPMPLASASILYSEGHASWRAKKFLVVRERNPPVEVKFCDKGQRNGDAENYALNFTHYAQSANLNS
jgi:hypothetical protein